MWPFRKSQAPITIGALREHGRRMAIWCGACKTMTYIAASELPHTASAQLDMLEKVYRCPECGYSNGRRGNLLTLGADAN